MGFLRSIGAKVIALTVVSVLACTAVGVIGINTASDLRARLTTAAEAQEALHNQSEVDGANHALQYDALLVATTDDAGARDEGAKDLDERIGELTEGIAANRKLLGSNTPELVHAFADIDGPLAAYAAAGNAVSRSVAAGAPVTGAQVDAVDAAQADFDGRFDGLTDAINAYVAAVRTKADRDAAAARQRLLFLLVFALLFVPAAGLLIRRAVSRNLAQTNQIVAVVDAATAGDLTGEVTVGGDDPIGRVGTGLGRLLTDLRRSISGIGDSAGRLARSADGLLALSHGMAATAEATSTRAAEASEVAGHVAGDIDAVTHGTEAMGSAIQQIASSAATAATVATKAVEVARDTNAVVAKLDTSSGEIGDVVRVISGIAEQTNLLALNATIEAARAGEAGKGFAVVASEVKDLAQETASATADIVRRIETIQADARGAIAAINEIGTIVGEINDIQATIATAVAEQTANSSAIRHSVTEAAARSTGIADATSDVARTSGEASQGATDTRRAAEELSQLASELRRLVGGFRY